MITYTQAKAKLTQLDPDMDADTLALAHAVLERAMTLTPANHDDSPAAKDLFLFLEHRLAQSHLRYLAPDQVNGVWGGSTTTALQALGLRYGLRVDLANPAIGADFLCAILDGSKANEQPLPPADSYDWLKAQVLAHSGFLWTNTPMEFNAVGIRGYMVPKGVVPNEGNRWNDTIFLAWIDERGQKRVQSWAASTDPGVYYYHTRPLNPTGCAHLVAPQQIRYTPGPHGRSQAPAFVQDSTVTVARTNSANYTDRTRRFTDTPYARFWCNLHAGFAWSEEQGVDASSAGCQVIKAAGWTDWRWLSLRNTLYTDRRRWFWYTLLDGAALKG